MQILLYFFSYSPPIILWHIWLNRNENIFANTKQLINLAPISTLATQTTYLTNIPQRKQRLSKASITWQKPREHHYKVNIDGAYDPSSHCDGAGGVFHDSSRHWIYIFSKHIPTTNAVHAKLLALHQVLSLAIIRRIHPLMIETDSHVLL